MNNRDEIIKLLDDAICSLMNARYFAEHEKTDLEGLEYDVMVRIGSASATLDKAMKLNPYREPEQK